MQLPERGEPRFGLIAPQAIMANKPKTKAAPRMARSSRSKTQAPENLLTLIMRLKIMRKSLAILLAAASLGMGGGSASSFAAEGVSQKAAASPEAATQQKIHRPSQRKMRRMQKYGGNSSALRTHAQPEAAPNPSQRGMRQKLKAAKPKQAPVAGNPESH